MNNEFQWRNEMRKLGGAVEPARDLWPSIAARVAAEPADVSAAFSRRRQMVWLAVAATVLIAVGSTLTAYRWQRAATPLPVPANATAAAAPTAAATAAVAESSERPSTALDWAVPADPQLAATAQNLDNASAQLQDALERRPDAVFLVGLLNRTNAQRLRLMRKSPYAG
jgi:hypothetical protein